MTSTSVERFRTVRHGARRLRYAAPVGLAYLVGQVVLVLAAALAAAVLFVALKRWAAATGYACPRPLLAVLTAVLAAPMASSALRLVGLRSATSFDGDVPELFLVSLVAAALLALALGRVSVTDTATPKRAHFFGPVLALAALPFLAWLLVAGLPARAQAQRNAVRSAYDEARGTGDAEEAQRLLDENPWLGRELDAP